MSNDLKVLKKQADDFVMQANLYEVTDASSEQEVIDIIKEAKRIKTGIKKVLDPFVKDARAAYDAARKRLKDYVSPLDEGERILRDKAGEYRRIQAQKEAEARAKAQEKLDPNDIMGSEVEVITKAQKPEGGAYRTTWHAKVTDLKALAKAVAEGKVPEAYIAPQLTALNKQASIVKGESNIPGVAFESRKVLSVR